MGEYADFVESYGYDASDPDAMDSIMSSWAKDERDHELQKKFQYELEKGKFAPSKPYHNSQIKTLGFNNFKPFSKEIQSFSKKPITLIYGPNSIGKSSFIHMSAYSRYIQKTKNLDLVNTDMFGDNINLGGFSKFIHKRDRNNTLTLEYEFEDCSEAIIDYLKLKQDISLDTIKALQLFTVEELETIINNSEKYILGVFTEANKVETCLYCPQVKDFGSGINGNNTTFTKQQNEKLILKRKNNYLCNTIYPEEIHTSNNGNYRLNVIKNYIFSGYYEIETENDNSDDIKIVNINDIKNHKFLNEKGEFFNQDTKSHFISDILIPFYINHAKLSFIETKNNANRISPEKRKLTDIEITDLATKTKETISNLVSEMEFLQILKDSNISLKISANIAYIAELDKEVVSEVKYFIDNELFDHIKLENNGIYSYIRNESKDYNPKTGQSVFHDEFPSHWDEDEFIIPSLFKNMPYRLFTDIYEPNLNDNEKSTLNLLHESSMDILFLSFKSGYRDIIGAFNDMLGLDEMQYIGPLRFYPERDASFKELDSDESIIPDSQSSWSYLKKDASLRETINEWLKDETKLKTPYEIKYRKLYDLESGFSKPDFEKFTDIKKQIDTYNTLIKKYSITSDTTEISNEFENDLINVLDSKGEYSGSDNSLFNLLDELRKYSQLNEEEQYTYCFKQNYLKTLSHIEYKEEFVFEDLRNGTKISNRDLGLGISQILPILIATNRQKNMTIAVEQPELHLHPAVQCEIADEFIRSYKHNKNNFLIETHSEHLLLRIMKRMRHTAEGKIEKGAFSLTPDDVCLLYIDSHKGKTFIRELKLDKDGTLLSKWPNGFFEESYNEMFS